MKPVVSPATSMPVHQAMQQCISEQRVHIHHHGNLIFQLKGKLVFFTFLLFHARGNKFPEKILIHIL
jgi:hypothetical protein